MRDQAVKCRTISNLCRCGNRRDAHRRDASRAVGKTARADRRTWLFLQGLNDGLAAILERAGTTMFATAFFGVIELAAGTFKYACAGHPGPVIAGTHGVRQIASERSQKGPGLGLIKGAIYPTQELDLAEIDRMVLFTDGILETENQSGEPFFENRLMEIIGAKSADPLESLLDGVLSSALAFSEGQRFDDDICLLGVELTRGVPA